MTQIEWDRYYPIFQAHEFDSPDELGSGRQMRLEIVRPLYRMRKRLGRALRVTSGWRTRAHNRQGGGADNSAHLDGWAVDIAVGSGRQRLELVELALRYGIRRIGVYKHHVHLDVDPEKPDALW